MIVDNFAGGGGASTGIEEALGRPVDLAVNHSRTAVAMHRANHPETAHHCQDIWTVDPREACGSRGEVAGVAPYRGPLEALGALMDRADNDVTKEGA